MSSLTVAWSSRSFLFPSYGPCQVNEEQAGITAVIPPAKGRRLMFGATAADAARIVQCQTFPSKQVVRSEGDI